MSISCLDLYLYYFLDVNVLHIFKQIVPLCLKILAIYDIINMLMIELSKERTRMEDLKRKVVKRKTRQLKMTLPIPPSVNSIYYNTRGGGRRLKAGAERYIRDVRALCNLFVEEQGWEKRSEERRVGKECRYRWWA